jgi:exosome complex component RRP45
LAINHTPFCLTFAFFAEKDVPPVLDPSQLESVLSEGTMSLALNAQRELCVVQKAGGVPLPADEILKLVGKVKVAFKLFANACFMYL